ncbi:lipopolysaccharide biosynthesis protein [Microvirga sp. BT688]|uniref:lipopolysaccharide biosynthesis protein n=1 Tax=Microvirga sp. TaxID=1873136 RepID=UPI0016854E1D|nr:lipopolysaccharide biosynthesis protein [Microvirga sp.]MBD2746936.1 lipopolysaccharide biosynthesis protein [Microvirga sp.]
MLWTAFAMGSQAIVQVLSITMLARLITPGDFGVFSAALLATGLLSIFSQFGIGSAIVQRRVLEERHLRTGFTLSLLLNIGFQILIWIAAPLISAFFKIPELTSVMRFSSLVFTCQAVSVVAEALVQRDLRFGWLSRMEAITFTIGFVGVGLPLAWIELGVWALAGAHVTQHSLRTLVLLVRQPHPKALQLDWRTVRELLHFGSGLTLARLGNYLAQQGDQFIVGRWLGSQALGLYSHAYQLMTAPALLVGRILDSVLFPTMAQVQLEPSRLARGYRSGLAISAVLVLPASMILAIVAPEIVLLLLGPKWLGVVPPFQALVLGTLFRTSDKLSDSVTRATGAVHARAWRQAVFAVSVLILALVGQQWGVEGVALGVLIAMTANFVMMAHLSVHLTNMRWSEFAGAHLPGVALAGVLSYPTWMFAEWLRNQSVPPIVFLLEVGLFDLSLGALLCWILPSLFLGRDVQWLIQAITELMMSSLQRSSNC